MKRQAPVLLILLLAAVATSAVQPPRLATMPESDAAPPTTDDYDQAVVYRDVLSLGWEDWSWYSGVHLASTQHAHTPDGSVSIRAELQPWGALSLVCPSGFRTSPYQWIEFYIYVGENTDRPLSIYFNDTSDNELMPKVRIDDPAFIAMGEYVPNRWQRVRIPLSQTGAAETDIMRINIKNESAQAQERFWVDGIRFLGSTPIPTPAAAPPAYEADARVVYRDALASAWEDWSWYSKIDPASREHAHSKPVSIKATLGATGALSLHFPGLDTAPYYWLEFYIYVGDHTLRRLSVYFTDTGDNELMPRVSVDDPAFIAMGEYIANRWQRVRIPLSRTGGADTQILRINIRDESGSRQEAFWIDDIRLLPAFPESG